VKKFKTERYYPARIAEMEVLRETAQCVYVAETRFRRPERREMKETDFHRIHDSWEEAHAHLLERAERALINARQALQQAQDVLGNVKGMRKPEDA
jgi:electron transfer flavoprotein alpha subunit